MPSKYHLLLYLLVVSSGLFLYQSRKAWMMTGGNHVQRISEQKTPPRYEEVFSKEHKPPFFSIKDKQLVSATFFTDKVKQSKTIYQQKVATLKKHKLWSELDPISNCTGHEKGPQLCDDTRNCSTSLPAADSSENIKSILAPLTNIKDGALEMLKDIFEPPSVKVKYVFLTAASANHFTESQAMIETLDKNILPGLKNYLFYYYDMGLHKNQVELLQNFSKAVVRKYPFDRLPGRFSYLRCYTWKPLILQAHFDSAEYVIWMDSSVRFTKNNKKAMFQKLRMTGVLMSPANFPFAQHTSMHLFSYFNSDPCHYSMYQETEANFILLHNQPFVRRLIMDPWVACAVDPNCMCHYGSTQLFRCPTHTRRYGKCHRYDQSTIGLIVLKLFRRNIATIQVPKGEYAIISRSKETGPRYLEELYKNTRTRV
ncbi:uncharacterized protein [Haliotis cracherodii]|uniref:uncharacterized protein isoform X1 n=1 Tax=Haliotis cracherodii TaxID=6455 RepID=UPI0039EA1C83